MDDRFLDSLGDVLVRAQKEATRAWHDEIDLVDLVVAIVDDPNVIDALIRAGRRPDFDALRGDRYAGPPQHTGTPKAPMQWRTKSAPGGEITISPLLRRALGSCSEGGPAPRAVLLLDLVQKASDLDPQVSAALGRMNLDLEAVQAAVRAAAA